jgi:hypothetical protein
MAPAAVTAAQPSTELVYDGLLRKNRPAEQRRQKLRLSGMVLALNPLGAPTDYDFI